MNIQSKNSNIKRIIALILVVVTLFSVFAISASAASYANAFDVPNSSKYAKVYTISRSGKTIPYTSRYLKTRGTTKGASSSAYIDNSTDELYLMDVGTTNGKTWAYVSYPISSGRRNAYIYLSAISPAGYGKKHIYYSSSHGKFYCSPRKGGSLSSSYYVDKGDRVYVLCAQTSGTNCQIMYPTSNGKWRIAWCTYNDARKYLDNVSNSSTSNNQNNSTYSVSGNVVTLKGVRLYEYPLGSKVPSSYYFNVNGKSTYVGAKQCYGFACYCEMKLYGSCWHTNKSHFQNLSGSVNVKPNADQFKSLITKAGVGAHLRTKNGHSMIIANVTSNGFTVIDANASGNCKVELRTYTWNGYLSSSFGKSGIAFIEIYK